MRPRIDARACAAALGLAAVALLPAWDAALSLPASQRTWEPLAWLAGGTLLLAALMLLVGVAKGRWRLALGGLVCILVGWLVGETLAFFYVDLKDKLAFVAGARYPLVRNGVAAVGALAVLGAMVYAVRQGLAAARRAAVGGLALLGALPLVLVVSYFVSLPPAPQPQGGVANRTVVVLVFDELDDTAIAADPGGLPHFTALGTQALSARQMFPPANYTSESLPGMLTGEIFHEALFSRQEVHVRPDKQAPWVNLSGRGTLLSDALERGGRAELIGWHLPYCSIFRKLPSCWDDAAFRVPGRHVSLPVWLFGHSKLVAAAENRALREKEGDLNEYSRAFFASAAMYRLHRIGEIFGEQRRRLLDTVQAQKSELVFAHLACPHAPSLHREQARRMDMYAAHAANLRECDRLLGEIRAALDQGTRPQGWTLIVTSDHWFRGRDWREAGRPAITPTHRRTVPFYLLASGESGGAAHSTDTVSNSRVLRRLVGEAADPSFTHARARALIEAQGDAPTILRSF